MRSHKPSPSPNERPGAPKLSSARCSLSSHSSSLSPRLSSSSPCPPAGAWIRTQATLMTASCPGVGKKDILADIIELMFQISERNFPALQRTGFLRTVVHSADFERAPDSGPTRVPGFRVQRSYPETIRNSPLFWIHPAWQVVRLHAEQACYKMRFAIEHKAAPMTDSQCKTLGYVRGSTHEQAINGLSLEARKRKAAQYAPATAPPLASRASNRSLARLACVDPETRKTGHEEEDRTD